MTFTKKSFLLAPSACALAITFVMSAGCSTKKKKENRSANQPAETDIDATDGVDPIDDEDPTPKKELKTFGPKPFFPLATATSSTGLRRLTNEELKGAVAAFTGVTPDLSTFPQDKTIRNFASDSSNLKVADVIHQRDILLMATRVAAEMNLVRFRCSLNNCTQDDISSYLRSATSFQPSSEDLAKYYDIYVEMKASHSHEQAQRAVVQAFLASPYFIYRSEIGQNSGQLSARELAWKLSYFLWGEGPDDQLLSTVEQDQLLDPTIYQQQVNRLISSTKTRNYFPRFMFSWLGLDKFNINRIPAAKDLPAETTSAMVEEVDVLIRDVLFTRQRGLSDLILADYTFMNRYVGTLYGQNLTSTDFVKVPLNASERVGLLSTPLVLAAHAKESGKSPIQRGLFIVQQLLCLEFPKEAGTASTKLPGGDSDLTYRDRFAMLEKVLPCANCHQSLNSGFAFEQFDSLGRAISPPLPAKEVIGILNIPGRENMEMHGAVDAASKLAKSEDLSRCFVSQLYRRAQGRMPGSNDSSTLTSLHTGFVANEQNVPWLLRAIANSDEFKKR